MRISPLIRIACVVVALAFAGQTFAQVFSTSNAFPDPFGIYKSVGTVFYPIPPGGLVTLEGLTLSSPAGSIAPPLSPASATWGPAAITADTAMSFFGGPTLLSSNVDVASASITGLADDPPFHFYATEMLSLNLTGLPFGAQIRESPTLASTGNHSITDVPGGYVIDSFFDVFTELSLDGGATWFPSTGPMHIENPEPTALGLLAVAVPFICRRSRRRA